MHFFKHEGPPSHIGDPTQKSLELGIRPRCRYEGCDFHFVEAMDLGEALLLGGCGGPADRAKLIPIIERLYTAESVSRWHADDRFRGMNAQVGQHDGEASGVGELVRYPEWQRHSRERIDLSSASSFAFDLALNLVGEGIHGIDHVGQFYRLDGAPSEVLLEGFLQHFGLFLGFELQVSVPFCLFRNS